MDKRILISARTTLALATLLCSTVTCSATTTAFPTLQPTPTRTDETPYSTVPLLNIYKPPPPPPGPPISPTPPASNPIPARTYALHDGQCGLGKGVDNALGQLYYAGEELLYIDIGSPATCSGSVVGWEVCFTTEGLDSSTFDLLLMRLDDDRSVYHVRETHTIVIEQPNSNEQSAFTCLFNPNSDPVSISRGDYIAFVCNDDIKIMFAQRTDEGIGTLRVFNLSSITQQQTQNMRFKRQSIGIDSIPSDGLQMLSEDLVPLFRIIINESEVNTTITPTPSKTKTHPTPCPTNNGGPTTIFTTVFTSVVIVSVVVIFVLFIIVCLMGCYICQIKCKCFKCIKKLCTCCRKRRVAHRITVEPITDQSMQYNDVYIPQDPRHIITGGKRYRADIHDNPAYETTITNRSSSAILDEQSPTSNIHDLRRTLPSQDALSTATFQTEISTLDSAVTEVPANRPERNLAGYEGQTFSGSEREQSPFEDSRNLDHTYEMIRSIRFAAQ